MIVNRLLASQQGVLEHVSWHPHHIVQIPSKQRYFGLQQHCDGSENVLSKSNFYDGNSWVVYDTRWNLSYPMDNNGD